jgi:formamidopyrimidine-DNA glycosylase
MPELPEVETVRSGLARLLPSRVVKSVTFDWPKSFPNDIADVDNFLVGAGIVSVKRRAKVLIIELSTSYSLVIHLKMTGQLVFKSKNLKFGAGHPSDSLVGKLPDRSTRVEITFIDGSKLFFNDQRKFGWMKLLPSLQVMNLEFFKKVGPEPLEPEFTWQVMKDRLTRRKNSIIKAVLLDQSVIAGIGNIYADESLWAAQLNPETVVYTISDAKIKKLHKELINVLRLSIEKGGSTDRNYVNAEGLRGSYIDFAKVFRRNGQPCFRCGHEIIKTRVAGRGTHLCPYCQPKAKDIAKN